MNGRYEIKERGNEAVRGERASAPGRALRLLRQAQEWHPRVPWLVWDRLERCEVSPAELEARREVAP